LRAYRSVTDNKYRFECKTINTSCSGSGATYKKETCANGNVKTQRWRYDGYYCPGRWVVETDC
jgi:hypothetical protein